MARSVPSYVFQHAQERPDQVALVIWDNVEGITLSVTYKQLADMIVAGAVLLRANGVAARDRFAFLANNSVGYLALSLGGMCLGAVSINLNWRQPNETNELLMRDLDVKTLIFDKTFKKASQEAQKAVPGLKTIQVESVCTTPLFSELPFAPPELDSATDIIAAEAAMDADRTAAVFFTGGTTGTPKAVPHSHASLCWFATQCRAEFSSAFDLATVPHAGTVCFTPYFHVMGFVANTVFNLVSGVRAAILADPDAKLNPALMLAAAKDIKPSVINTIPWIVEGLVGFLQADNKDAKKVLSSLHMLTYGGAALPLECPPVLKAHGVVVACSYGQTELAGPVMFGKPDGDPNALRPFKGVQYELLRGEEDGEDEGELCLIQNESSTAGYWTLRSETKKYRSLTQTDDPTVTTRQRFCTGDRFKRITVKGQEGEWLLYLCRADDLLVHTSGEMTNPLPTEQAMVGQCIGVVKAACMSGTNRTRSLLMLELCEGVDPKDEKIIEQLNKALEVANSAQPQYSHVLPNHVMLLPPNTLPVTVKGNVQRGKAEKQLEAELDGLAAGSGEANTLADGEDGEVAYDSLAFSSETTEKKKANYEFITGARFVAAMWVVAVHHTDMAYARPGSVNATTASLDAAMRRAGVAMSFFMVTSGFGCHLSNASKDVLKSGWATLKKFLVERLDRIVFTLWLNLTLLFVLGHWLQAAPYTASDFFEFFLCTLTLNAPPAFSPGTDLCAGDGWFIGALVPMFLLYPVLAIFIKFADKRLGVGGLVGIMTVAWLAYFVPLGYFTWANAQASTPASPDSLMGIKAIQRSILFQGVDFFIGCCLAQLVKKHAKLTSEEARPDDVSLLPQWRTERTNRKAILFVRGALADACVVAILVYAFTVFKGTVCVNQKATCIDENLQMLLDCHSYVPVMCLLLYGACAEGGAGLFARLLAHPALEALGKYSFDAYLLSAPLGAIMIGLGFEMSGMDFVNIEGFMAYFLLLWILSGINADLIMEPLTKRFRSLVGV